MAFVHRRVIHGGFYTCTAGLYMAGLPIYMAGLPVYTWQVYIQSRLHHLFFLLQLQTRISTAGALELSTGRSYPDIA